MATFSRPTFNYLSYAAARPNYPRALYNHIFTYLIGPKGHCVDLGTGHGLVARALAPSFTRVTATDPSSGMLAQANELTSRETYPNITYELGTCEAISETVSPGSVDLIVAAQCAHWFDYAKAWPQLHQALRQGGVFALWGYGGTYFESGRYPKATKIVNRYAHGPELDKYWTEPGRSIVEGRYRAVVPPVNQWDVTRIEYVPATEGSDIGVGSPLIAVKWKVGELEAYFRTWSAVHRWKEANPEVKSRAEGAKEGDVIDRMMDEIAAKYTEWRDPEFELNVEWETALVVACKK